MIIQENGYHIWESKDLEFLRENYTQMTNADLASSLGIKLTTCRTKLYKLGLKRMDLEYWDTEQTAYLRANYEQIGDTELAAIFSEKWIKNKGWSKKHIEKKRRYLKLKRTKSQLRAIKARNTENGMFSECAAKRWETMGVTENGVIKIWQYSVGGEFAVVKTDEGFVHYNRWLYENRVRPLSSDDLVVTRSGKTVAQSITDIEIIDRAEHARRNSLKRYPEPLRKTVRIMRKIKKELNN
jgi:hypothetical protein